MDCEWLKLANEHRTAAGLSRLTESDLEIIIHEFETQANSSIRNELELILRRRVFEHGLNMEWVF